MKTVNWVQDLCNKVEAGKSVSKKQRGDIKMEIVEGQNKDIQVFHLGTLILAFNYGTKEVQSIGGAYSLTDCRYINNILYMYDLHWDYKAQIRQGDIQLVCYTNNSKGVVVNV